MARQPEPLSLTPSRNPLLHTTLHLATQLTNGVVDAFNKRRPSRRFNCPVCSRSTMFSPVYSTTGTRLHARCPHCGSLERHRLQAYVVKSVLIPRFSANPPRVLHVAPEAGLAPSLKSLASSYRTADAVMPGVDDHVDLRSLPYDSASFDLVYASHVLEHIDDDVAALGEIHRILAPGGVAVLPVPLVVENTVEYESPNPFEAEHVRAPGPDYFDKYKKVFANVEVVWSHDAPTSIQPFVLEDRSSWPTHTMPDRSPSGGAVHEDAVPLCWV